MATSELRVVELNITLYSRVALRRLVRWMPKGIEVSQRHTHSPTESACPYKERHF